MWSKFWWCCARAQTGFVDAFPVQNWFVINYAVNSTNRCLILSIIIDTRPFDRLKASQSRNAGQGTEGTLAVCSLLLQQFGAIWSYELKQWFPTNAPRHTNAPQDVIRCAARHIEVKFNQVSFTKFQAANVSQYGTLTISDSNWDV